MQAEETADRLLVEAPQPVNAALRIKQGVGAGFLRGERQIHGEASGRQHLLVDRIVPGEAFIADLLSGGRFTHHTLKAKAKGQAPAMMG
jgi:hypothetical protein